MSKKVQCAPVNPVMAGMAAVFARTPPLKTGVGYMMHRQELLE
jgi:hypothetical protein